MRFLPNATAMALGLTLVQTMQSAIAQQDPVVVADAGNKCPSGYAKLTTKKGCVSAMKQVDLDDFQGTETDSDWPGGCYHCADVPGCSDGTWYNRAKVGSSNRGAAPICAVPDWEAQQENPIVIAAAGNVCPSGYVKLKTKKGCESAMKQVGLDDFQGTETESGWPGGCYHCADVPRCSDGTWFNRADVGSSNGGAAPICAVPGWEAKLENPIVIAAAGNDCPSGFVKLKTKEGCEFATKEVDLSDFQGTESDSDWPGGCYHCADVPGCSDGTWFNRADVGSSNKGATPICAAPGWEDKKNAVDTLFVGDSDIDYWPTEHFASSKNVGVAGSVCNGVSKKLDQQLQQYKPKRVAIVCGENDLYGQSVGDTFDDFKVAIGKILDSGARALYLGTKPEPATKSLHDEYREYDAKIREYVNELKEDSPSFPPLVMVDVYPAFVEIGNPKDLYQRDRLHLSRKGYSYWNTWTKTALADTSGCARWKSNACASNTSAIDKISTDEEKVTSNSA